MGGLGGKVRQDVAGYGGESGAEDIDKGWNKCFIKYFGVIF